MSELDQPNVIETEDVLSLRAEVTLTDVIQAEVRSMPFHLLTPDQFELLLWDLFYSECNDTDLEFDNARLMITGADQGRDVWLTNDGEPSGLIQCKREEKKYGRKDVLKEVVKFLLHSELTPALLPHPKAFTYCLALGTDPKGEVDDFFERPLDWLKDNMTEVESVTKQVIKNYQRFKNTKSDDVIDSIFSKIKSLSYQLIRPHELNRWLDIHQDVRKRFFKLPQDIHQLPYGSHSSKLVVGDLKHASLPLHNWQKTIENRFIKRPELETLEHRLKTEESKCYLLTGGAGSGKSSLLSSLYERLLDTKCTVLAIKADELDKDINDLEDLAAFLKCEGQGSLVASLLELSKESPLVLIIDQMDAVSEVMDQSSSRFRVLIDLILGLKEYFEARKTYPIHIIASSRPFEASFDTRFTQLDAEEICLNPLLKEEVELFLEEINIHKANIPASMYPTLQVPFALSLYVSLVKAGDNKMEITSKNLLSRWLEKKLANDPLKEQCDKFLQRLASDMVREEVLRRPISAYTLDYQSLLTKLESVGILVRFGDNIGFSHQAWLDDFQSQSFLSDGSNFYEFVLEKQNGLFSRSTILRGLEYLREHDKPQYHQTMDKLLFDPSVRRHIYHLLIDVMTSTLSPDYDDAERIYRIIEDDDALASRVISKTARKWNLWREYLADELPSLMQNPVLIEDVTLMLIEEVKSDEDNAISLIESYWKGEKHHSSSFGVLSRAKASSIKAIQLAEAIISTKMIDTYSISIYIQDLFENSKHDSALQLLRAWLCTERDNILWERFLSIESYVAAHPSKFIEVLFPWFIEILDEGEVQKEVSRAFRRSASFGGDFDTISKNDGMVGVLLQALVHLATNNPSQFTLTAKKYSCVDFDEVQSLLAIAFASNPMALTSDIVNYLIEDETRLCIGHGCFNDEQNVMHFVNGHLTMMLLEESSPHWSILQAESVREAIESYTLNPLTTYPDVEVRRYVRSKNEEYRLSLLARLPSQILTPRRRRQVSERDTDGQLKVGQRCRGVGMASLISSPMSSEQMELATAENIMKMLDGLSDPSIDTGTRWRRWRGAELSEFSQAFSQFAVAEPQKATFMLRTHFFKRVHEGIAGDAVAKLSSIKTLTTNEIRALINDLNSKGFTDKAWVSGVARAYEEIARRDKGLNSSEIALLVEYLNHYIDAEIDSPENYDQSHDEAILFGHRGGFSFSSTASINILNAIYMGLLARKRPDHDQWVCILLNYLHVSKSESTWQFILTIQGEQLYWANAEKVNSLFENLLTSIPALFESPILVHTLWKLAERLKEPLLMQILMQWEISNNTCKQAAAELISGLVISNRASESMAAYWDSLLQSGNVAVKKGGIYAATSGWCYQGNVRANSHEMLMSCARGDTTQIASALNSLFQFSKKLPQDGITLQLLLFFSEQPELVQQLSSHNLLEALVKINPRPKALRAILLIVKTIIDKKLKEKPRGYIQDVDKLIELTVTLQRTTPFIKEQAMSMYERLLDAVPYQAEQAAEAASRS
ncbi:restriction endonuclease [Vibrio parahaemolyticus]|nr:restriction endonuclease [Vibrio parahaemolyticus]EHH1230326.1 restriction endonuclease [Vibrio parahaemolyticus]